MKKHYRKSKKLSALRRKAGYVVGASLLAAGVQAQAAGTAKPEQVYEGGAEPLSNWVELSAGGLMTDGNKAQAQQRTQLNSGAFGGIEDLHVQSEIAKKTTFKLDGHGIYDNHNYKLSLGVEKEDLGFIKFSFENFRTLDANNGGYAPATATAYPNAGDALALDRGKISLEAAYNKEGQPKVNFKYTHSYRNGDKGTTIWGQAYSADSGANLFSYGVYPGINSIDEKSDAFQLDVTHKIKKVDVGLGVRYEHGEMNDALKQTFIDQSLGAYRVTDRQGTSYDLLNFHSFAESWLKPNQFVSAGFSFANLDNTFTGSRIYGDDFDVIYSPGYANNGLGYSSLNGGSHENQYVLNLNWMYLPTKEFTITPSLRVQQEDWDGNSDGLGTSLSNSDPFSSSSTRNALDVRERLEARYTGVTNWVFTACADWTEGQGNLNINGGLTGAPYGPSPVQAQTDDSRFFQKYSLNARWYPVKQASLDVGGYYKDNQYDYNFLQDSITPNNGAGFLYPAFLVYQGFQTWDGNVRLTLRPFSKITLVSRYEYQDSSIATRPDPASGLSELDSSRMHSHIVGQNISWTPLNWLSFQAGGNYVVSETETPASAVTQSILNSQNNYWTVNFNTGLVLDDKTDLNLGYYYYRAADGQGAVVNGLPLGTDAQEHSASATLTRRINKNLRLNLKYAFTRYEDYVAAGAYNFDSHVVFTSLQYRF